MATDENKSFWKKEIRLLPRRKRDRAGYLAPEQYAKEKTSFWKKEISFSRRRAKIDPPASKAEVPESQTDQPAAEKPFVPPRPPAAVPVAPQPPAVAPAPPQPAPPAPVGPPPAASAPAPPQPAPPAPVGPPPAASAPAPPQPAPPAPVGPPPAASAPAPPQAVPPAPVVSLPSARFSAPSPDPSDEHTLIFELDPPADVQEPVESPASTPIAEFDFQPEPRRTPPEDVGPAAAPLVARGPYGEIDDSAPPTPRLVREPVEVPRIPVAPPVAEEPLQAVPEVEAPAETRVEPEQPQQGRLPAGDHEEPMKRLSRTERKARRTIEKGRRGGRRAHKTKKIVGLKIGASQLAAARVSNNGSAELLQVARQPLDPGIVVAGELRDPESLATALKAFFKKNKLPTRGVRLGLSNNRIGVRIFEIGGIDEPEQLKNAIRFRAQETLPIPLEEAVLDYHVLDESVDENGAVTRRVLLVVAYRDLIERYVSACRKAGLRLVGVDLEAFALLRALGKAPSEHSSEDRIGLVVVSVGHDRSTFAVSDGRACEFTRVLDWGGFSLNVAIARALDLTPSQSEQIKLGLSLTDKALVPQGLTSEQADTAREAVRRALEAFARDLVSSLRFYQSQPDSLGIRELVLTGGTAGMPGLASELERLIGVYVRVGDPLGRVKVARRVNQDEHVGSLAAAIGLGIED